MAKEKEQNRKSKKTKAKEKCAKGRAEPLPDADEGKQSKKRKAGRKDKGKGDLSVPSVADEPNGDGNDTKDNPKSKRAAEEHDGRVPSKAGRQPNKLKRETEGEVEKTHQYIPKKVVVSGLPYSTTEEVINDLFKDVGPIVQMYLSRFPDSGRFSGLAFITFQNEDIAKKALELDGMKMGNRFLKVERCRQKLQMKSKAGLFEEPPKVEGCHSVYVGNISCEATEDDIRNFFGDSKIETVRLAINKKTGRFRGFCHVDFADDESLQLAISKNQAELHGKKVKVSHAVRNRE